MCQEREATVHLTQTSQEFGVEEGVDPETVDLAAIRNKELTEHHFCEECADKRYPGMEWRGWEGSLSGGSAGGLTRGSEG